MQRMTDALSRMLNDPSTRLAMRTLGDREVAATRNYQRSQSEQQIEEGDEMPSDSNNNSEVEVEPETNPDRREDEQMRDNEEIQEAHEPVEGMDESGTGSIKQVPDITVEHCSQSLATNNNVLELSSHEDKTVESNIKTENKSDKEQKVVDVSAPKNIAEQLESLEKCPVDKTG